MSYHLKVGDKVEITWIHLLDDSDGIKVGDVAKIVGVINERWYECANPNWLAGKMPMKYTQLKKL